MDVISFNEAIQDVIDWNAAARRGIHDNSKDVMRLQTSLVREEIVEALTAAANDDVVEYLDGLADIFVTFSYKAFLAVGHAELDYNDDDVRRPYIDANDHFLKTKRIMQLCLLDRFNESDASVYSPYVFTDYSYEMSALFAQITQAEIDFSVDMAKVLGEVSRSNWSKFPEATQDIDLIDESVWIEKNRGKAGVHWETVSLNGIDRIVFRDGTGKIMKWRGYSPANIKQFLPIAV